MHTKIFLDSGDPAETREMLALGIPLSGQTTNPSLVVKHPDAQKRLASGKLFSATEINEFYQSIVEEVSELIPSGSVSIEVSATMKTSAEEMITEGQLMNAWIPNAHIKLPTIPAGLAAAHELTKAGVNVNMTLVFTESQAAAVYAATTGTEPGAVFISPFVGRYNDIGLNGLSLVQNISEQYHTMGDGHVEVLMASVRDVASFVYAIEVHTDIITAPVKILREWHELGSPQSLSDKLRSVLPAGLDDIPYEGVSLDQAYNSYNIQHDLTDRGLQKFADDWQKLFANDS